MRPQSVVENLSVGHIPDLLETPNSRNNSTGSQNKDNGENCDSITELPSTSLQLQHLVKGRPKRVKTRAPTRPLVTEISTHAIGEGIEAFFRPGSVTPTTLTPLVSPTSDETIDSLSFVDSPTMSRDDHNGKNCFTSEETTPILEERKPIKLERNSPLLKGVSWTPRSRSTDNISGEKYSPLVGRKSPLIKKQLTDASPSDTSPSIQIMHNSNEANHNRLHPPTPSDPKTRSPSNESIKSFDMDNNVMKVGNGKTPNQMLPPKPRPW